MPVTEGALFPTEPDAPPLPTKLARVAVEQGVDAPGGLHYGVPEELLGIQPGEIVEVPLGKGDTLVPGYVIGLESVGEADIPLARIKPIVRRVAGEGPAHRLPPQLIELARWMDTYYACPLGMVLSTMMPAAVKQGTGARSENVLDRTKAAPPDRLTPAVKNAWEALQKFPASKLPLPAKQLRDALGLRSTAPLNKLVQFGLLEERRRDVVRTRSEALDLLVEPAGPTPRPPTPTSEQQRAIEGIESTLGGFAPHLLFGVTGSGKTEVYLRAIEAALLRGMGAIVLVPEIMLTPQTAARFVARFGKEAVALLHSGLTASQRHQQWSRIAKGEASVAIGPRSAVFAPFSAAPDSPAKPLGLIIVDEEHDSSYKQDQLPRYHARNIAIKRAQIEGCPVVLGSATPALETWHNAQSGRFSLHELRERVPGAHLPSVQIVDFMEERLRLAAEGERDRTLGPVLTSALGRVLETPDEQAILLLNRRGLARCVCCSSHSCDWSLTCQHCDASMVVHASRVAGRVLRCHHCHAENTVPRVCPECDSKTTTFGFGTQHLEEELASLYPGAPEHAFARLDADTMRTGKAYADALRRFASGQTRVLLGTQMIAKGLDFPNVTLIGVVTGDTALELPDFRAAERTFQLVAQVAGRAGRSGRDARCVVQTVHPSEPAIRLAAAHNYRSFADEELAIRRDLGLPPYTRMARLGFRDLKRNSAMQAARTVAEAIRAQGDRGVWLDPPEPAELPRRADHYRFGLDLFARSAGALTAALDELRAHKLVKADAKTTVDVDPVALL